MIYRREIYKNLSVFQERNVLCSSFLGLHHFLKFIYLFIIYYYFFGGGGGGVFLFWCEYTQCEHKFGKGLQMRLTINSAGHAFATCIAGLKICCHSVYVTVVASKR